MENKVFEKNINHINSFNKNLGNKILSYDLKNSSIALNKTLKDEYNIIFNNIELHNPMGAVDEAKKIAKSLCDDKNSIRIIYGLGLGYLADEVSNVILNGRIIIYEPNLDILSFVLQIAQIDALYKKNVILCSNKEELTAAISNIKEDISDLSISFLDSYKKLFSGDIEQILDISKKILGEKTGNKNTFLSKAPVAFLNTFLNLKNILKNPDIQSLKDIYKNKTAIILGAGPSLAENIETVKNNQNKFVIFALNPTIKLLSTHGIKPDFIVDVETNNTLVQYDSIDTKEHYFIFEAFKNSEVYNLETKKTFNYISKGNFLNDWLREILNIKEDIETFGTVSYTAFMSAYLMGFSKIILLGQDLAYKEGFCYAKGSQFEELECLWSKEQEKYIVKARDIEKYAKSIETNFLKGEKALNTAKRYIESINKNLVTVAGQDGKYLPSKYDYLIFIDIFAKAACRLKEINPSISLINSSSHGALIEGFKNMPLEDVVLELEEIIKINLDDIRPLRDKKMIKEKLDSLDFTQLIENIERILNLLNKFIKEAKTKKIMTENAKKYLNKTKELLKITLKNNSNINFIINFEFNKIVPYFSKISSSDFSSILESIEKSEEIFIGIKCRIEDYKKGLNDCKTFILE